MSIEQLREIPMGSPLLLALNTCEV